MDGDRRDFLKKSAAVGGLVWAAPVISTVTASPALAATPCTVCVTAEATGLVARVNPGSPLEVTLGPFGQTGCVANVAAGSLVATAVCGTSDLGTCTASASVATLSVGSLIELTVAESSATAGTDPSNCVPTLSSSIATLEVGGTPIVITGAPNQQVGPIVVFGNVVFLVINEQFCDSNGDAVVRALHACVNILGIETEVIVAESRVQCCPCEGLPAEFDPCA